MTRLPAPDSPEANRLGCRCPNSTNHQGAGTVVDGVREYTIHPDCPVHSNPRAWYGRPLPKGKVAGALVRLLAIAAGQAAAESLPVIAAPPAQM